MKSDRFLSFLGITKKSGNLREGYNKCEEAVKFNKAKLIILSEDTSSNTKDKFNTYCNRYSIDVIEGYSKEELGRALGREEINVICVLDVKMSKRLMELWNEKNNRG